MKSVLPLITQFEISWASGSEPTLSNPKSNPPTTIFPTATSSSSSYSIPAAATQSTSTTSTLSSSTNPSDIKSIFKASDDISLEDMEAAIFSKLKST